MRLSGDAVFSVLSGVIDGIVRAGWQALRLCHFACVWDGGLLGVFQYGALCGADEVVKGWLSEGECFGGSF